MSERTYTIWKKRVEEASKAECEAQSVNWDYMIALYEKVDKIMKENNDDRFVDNIISKIYTDVTGLLTTMRTMRAWQRTVSKMHQVCVDDKGRMCECPDNVTAGRRWLFIHEDGMLLLFTMLAMYEGPYKNIINLLYEGTGDDRYVAQQVDERAKHLDDKYKIDVQYAMSRDLRNSIAHMSFFSDEESDAVVVKFTKRGKPPVYRNFTHDELISLYTETQDRLWPLFGAVLYWLKMKYGTMRLFDDAFFLARNGDVVRNAAVVKMLQPDNLNIKSWRGIVEKARHDLEL